MEEERFCSFSHTKQKVCVLFWQVDQVKSDIFIVSKTRMKSVDEMTNILKETF